MPDLHFGVLGPLEVHCDGQPIAVPSGRRRAVLACLLVQRGQAVGIDALVDAAWGEDPPRDPRSSLNTVLSRVRAVLGPEIVRAVPGGYLLDVSADTVDAEEFERLIERAKTASSPQAQRLLQRALLLWRGSAYAEFADTFANVEAHRLDLLRLAAVESCAAAAIDVGDSEAATRMLEGLLAEQPFREQAVELLMTGLYRAGRHAEALDRYRDYRALLADELGLDPSPTLRQLESSILGHDLTPLRGDRPEVPTWLDTSTAFIGRDRELTDLIDAVAANRVVTVTGPGGVGKTRLVAESLPMLIERLALPIRVVELAPVVPGRAGTAVADALGLGSDPDSMLDRIIEDLGTVDAIVVLDNCEHLLAEVAELVGRVARSCPRVRVLATSRHRLGTTSELVLPIETLDVAGPADAAETPHLSAAVRLLTDRVRRLRPSFGVTSANAADVVELCRRLDGLPLALELGAARVAAAGVDQVRAEVPDELTGAAFGDLRAVVEWSYSLIPEPQRRLLAGLTVFADDVSIADVHDMTEHWASWRGNATEALLGLAESSLVTGRELDGAMRYRMFVIVRSYATERLATANGAEAAHLAHAQWVADRSRQLADAWPYGDGSVLGVHLDRLAPEVAAALRWSVRSDRTELAASIAAAIIGCLHWTPGIELSELLTAVAERGAQQPGAALADGVGAGAFFAAERGELDRARRLAGAALQMSEPNLCVPALLTMGVVAVYAGDHAEAMEWMERVAAHPGWEGDANCTLALISLYSNDIPAAEAHARIALAAGPTMADASFAFARYVAGEVAARTDTVRAAELLEAAAIEADRVGGGQVSRVARVALFAVLIRNGRHEEAVGLGSRLLRHLHTVGAWPQLWTTVRLLAELLAAAGRQEDAVLMLAASTAPPAPPLVGEDVDRYARMWADLRGHLGDRVVDGICHLATNLSRGRVVDRAVRTVDDLVR